MIKHIEGNKDVKLIECVNPVKQKWRVRWNINPIKGSENITYCEYEFLHKPSLKEVKKVITDWYNQKIDYEILSGMVYQDMAVWLSAENQFNYKAAYDLAMQTGGKTLPITFKFGTEEEPKYKTFNTLEELSDFYIKSLAYVQTVLAKGWQEKDSIDFNNYIINE